MWQPKIAASSLPLPTLVSKMDAKGQCGVVELRLKITVKMLEGQIIAFLGIKNVVNGKTESVHQKVR